MTRKGRGKNGDPVSILADPNPRRRWEMAESLAKARLERDEMLTLVGALADKEPFVRWQASKSLASMGSRASLEVLLQALRTPPVARQMAAAEALGGLGDGKAVEPLLEAARSQHVGLRVAALEALGEMKAADADELFRQMLRDESPGVRQAASWGLGQIADPAAMDGLLVRLGDDQEHVLVRRSAAWALGKIRLDRSAALELAKRLGDSDPQVRWYVASALGRAGDAALGNEVDAALTARLQDEERALQGPVSEAAQRSLRRLRRRAALRRLLRLPWRRTDAS